ncbi:MAG: 5-deoxy-glucuronate isomerase [Janthinobacterium lividum]
MTTYHSAAGTAGAEVYDLPVIPESGTCDYLSLRVHAYDTAGTHTFDNGGDEVILVPLSGQVADKVDGEVDGTYLDLGGRRDLFTGPTDVACLPIGRWATLHSATGGRFAPCGSRTTTVLPFRYGPASRTPSVAGPSRPLITDSPQRP